MIGFAAWSYIICGLLLMEAVTLFAPAARRALAEIYGAPGLLRGPGVALLVLALLIFISIIRLDHPAEIYIFAFACYILIQSGLMIFHPEAAVRWMKIIYGENLERLRLTAVIDILLAGAFMYLGLFTIK